ncbi:Asnovolin E/Chermesin D methyltransferase nvfJ [Cladobotryum mycophilum]|uniref:Asnovolin E/Chermesin D methyltransferase nvfJ n=1 Tax=Cladobotryum mycophilum TaxID=491253 RepID=A0ABR0SXA3_9HYPO
MPAPIQVQSLSSPWSVPKTDNVVSHELNDDSIKSVEWYQPVIKSLPQSTVRFFEEYVGIKGEEAIKEHIYRTRDKAWQVLPYPCIGLFRFLDFSIHLFPNYKNIIQRVQGGETFLDLGCCFGQDIRKLAFDAGGSANLIGCDLEAPFLELGYELFGDRNRLKATFTPGDVFAVDFLPQYHGKVDIIYLGSFLHLFNEEQQKTIARQLKKLLRPRKGSVVFGRHLGADKGGSFKMESIGWDLYRHDPQTITALFQNSHGSDDVDEWEVKSTLSRYESANWDDDRRGWQGDGTKQMMFIATKQ